MCWQTRVGTWSEVRPLDLAEILEHRVDELKGVVDLVADLGTCEHNLATHEDQEDDLGLDHAVNETREQFRFVGAEVVVARSQTLETDGKLDITGTDNILDLEVCELGVESCSTVLALGIENLSRGFNATNRASG